MNEESQLLKSMQNFGSQERKWRAKSKASFGDNYYKSYIKGINKQNYKSQQQFKKKFIPQKVENGHFKEKFEFYL